MAKQYLMPCDCLQKFETHFEEKYPGQGLHIAEEQHQGFDRESRTLYESVCLPKITVRDKNGRINKKPLVLAEFCPFCGKAIKPQEYKPEPA